LKYSPESYYKYKSGKREGEVVELLMFKDYDFLFWHLSKIKKEKNQKGNKNGYEKHLEWILEKGETRKVKAVCPQCNENRATKFSALFSYDRKTFSIGHKYISCNEKKCLKKIIQKDGRLQLICEIKFSSIPQVTRNKKGQRDLGIFYRYLFNLPCPPQRLTAKEAFQFFKE